MSELPAERMKDLAGNLMERQRKTAEAQIKLRRRVTRQGPAWKPSQLATELAIETYAALEKPVREAVLASIQPPGRVNVGQIRDAIEAADVPQRTALPLASFWWGDRLAASESAGGQFARSCMQLIADLNDSLRELEPDERLNRALYELFAATWQTAQFSLLSRISEEALSGLEAPIRRQLNGEKGGRPAKYPLDEKILRVCMGPLWAENPKKQLTAACREVWPRLQSREYAELDTRDYEELTDETNLHKRLKNYRRTEGGPRRWREIQAEFGNQS